MRTLHTEVNQVGLVRPSMGGKSICQCLLVGVTSTSNTTPCKPDSRGQTRHIQQVPTVESYGVRFVLGIRELRLQIGFLLANSRCSCRSRFPSSDQSPLRKAYTDLEIYKSGPISRFTITWTFSSQLTVLGTCAVGVIRSRCVH